MLDSEHCGALDIRQLEPDDPTVCRKKLYFINEEVEDLLRRYLWTQCTCAKLRDQIMSYAPELIKQMIRKQHLHMIYPGQDESSFGDLVQTAWCQIERTLYKFRARPHCRICYNHERPMDSVLYLPGPYEYGIITYAQLFRHLGGRSCSHCNAVLRDRPEVVARQGLFGGSETILFRGDSKVFNMWSQVARTVILAQVKKEGRDRRNATGYRGHLIDSDATRKCQLARFFQEAREICKFNNDYLCCLDALQQLVLIDERPYSGLISKLVRTSGLARQQVTACLRLLRLRCAEFSDSPWGQNHEQRWHHAIDSQPPDNLNTD